MTLIELAVFVAMMAGMFALTLPVELRKGRWLRLGISVPFAFLIARLAGLKVGYGEIGSAGPGVMGIFSGLVLAIIWRGHIAHLGATKTTGLMFGDGRAGGGFRTDYREAQARIDERDLNAAIKAVRTELAKEPEDFEGLMLLAT